jgi:hypothetical protein
MNTISKTAFFAAAAALAATFAAAQAGAPTHVMPASKASARYDVSLSAEPQMGRPVLVTLIDRDTGKAVAGSRVAMLRPVYLGIKASPTIQNVPMLLPADGHGAFVCSADHHHPGAHVTFRATAPGGDAVWHDVQVKS